ncbi:RNA-directed DNA polymerase [Brucella pituitosa]|uniref:RNA-directed DNA polymerase n=1 Tax=Brucella pituitosa TaxID=571256 RepID=A0ABS3K511_9HYPH|nr:RNA-directed DNA polymerase [Brucella pituitosa]MBO1041982.1 RNA-directed DNA polymerase [Brucella pituitosa]
MPTKDQFKSAAKLAVKNIINYGDTDIFPYPFERFVLSDNMDDIVEVLEDYNNNYSDYMVRYSPFNVSALSPINYFGFRWATQLDYIWNAYFLACVLILEKQIEFARIAISEECIFSYRLAPDKESGTLFDKNINFRAFMQKSNDLSKSHNFVVICDISEFYPRLGHHRLENALRQIDGSSDYPNKIMNFLANFSRTNSFGLPIGGPAARILSELTINQIDRLLMTKGIRFTRFADDFHIFCNTREDAYKALIFLSEKLSVNQGLMLQKSKTRIMSSAEFQSTQISMETDQTATDDQKNGEASSTSAPELSVQRDKLISFSLRFDPYSPTADDDYEKLKEEVRKYDILELLKEELGKARVHTALTRKLIRAIQYLDDGVRDQAVLSVLDNSEVLYPLYSSILMMIDQVADKLSSETRTAVKVEIMNLIQSDSHVFKVDTHICYAIRVLSHFNEPEVVSLLQQIYEREKSPIIRRDIILILAKWGEWYWLSDIKNVFRQLTNQEKAAFIVSSYMLKDEGKHWREHIKVELSPYQKVILKWAGSKFCQKDWKISL